jgi:NAD+ kinase
MRVGFVLKRGKPEAVSIARGLITWLRGRGCELVVPEEHAELGVEAVPDAELGRRIDLLVVLGGDGALLHGAGLVADDGVPVLGINLGTLGFLAPFAPSEAEATLERALAGQLGIEERERLHVRLRRKGGDVVERPALNDAVISQGAMARLIELDASLDGKRVTVYRADGLIISTPTGSTAYNLAAGGPILAPGQRSVAITPICPHTLTNRPLVVPMASRLEIELVNDSPSVMLTVDGQWAAPVARGESVEIVGGARPLRLYRSDKSYFEILREKLSWGIR